ncbi:MAG: ABC transporter ATP-binding protein [Lachnospiraceae bacterium]|nr:ABC transporter ATP-binding protein [Lachnospiraceae bacterium]
MYIDVQHINKTFGDFQASKDVTFQVEEGRLVALLGPSGSGKTTILRMIAGLEHQDNGDIYINGELVNNLQPHERGIGLVFQNYALFPYLTVFDNIAYGIKIQKKSKEYIKGRVEELLEIVNLKGLGDRYPDQLSGGQRQRVAFARALAPKPNLILLDEPFSAIDAKVRKEMRSWLRGIITRLGVTSIFVTHDQDEAIEVSDEIIITNEGRVEQIGSPAEVYRNPQTPFVARFIGQSTEIADYGKLKGFQADPILNRAAVRPEFIQIEKAGAPSQYPNILEEGTVTNLLFRSNSYEVRVNVNGSEIYGTYGLDLEPLTLGEKVQVLISQLFIYNEERIEKLSNSGLNTPVEFYI